jgi:hypothetical protein
MRYEKLEVMRMRRSWTGLLIFPYLAAAPAASAQDLVGDSAVGEISFTDDTMQLRYRDAGRNIDLGRGSRASAAIFLSEARDLVFFGDLLFPADIGSEQLQLIFGPRMYAALLEDENNDVLSLSLGGEARFELTSKLAVAAQAFYAPDILTFGTADSLTDLSARLEYELQPRLNVFGGMRWFEFELIEEIDGSDERTLQEELFAGMSWRF